MKKLLSVILMLSILAGTLCVSASAWSLRADDSYSVGDVDNDSTVNGKDSAVLKSIIAGAYNASFSRDGADITADSSLDAKDSYLLKSFLSGAASAEEYESPNNVYKLTVGGYDISEFCIVLPEKATYENNVDYAASEMQKYIALATGVELEIVRENEERPAPCAIIYHMVDEDSELGRELGIEGYKYDITNGDVYIYGTRRGNMYCTYELLERLGYVFYSNDYAFIYETRCVEFAEGESKTHIPRLNFRHAGETFGAAGAQTHYFPRKLNGSQLYSHAEERYGTLTGPHFINAHSMGFYWSMATGNYTDDEHLYDCYLSGEKKQETAYSGPNPWQPCATSDKDYEVLFLGFRRTIRMLETWNVVFRDDTSSMSFSICDNQNGYCACRNCRAIKKTEGYSGLYVSLTNRAAKDIKEYYPGMKVMTIIYDHSIPENVRPEENVIIWFCGHGCNNHYFGQSELCGDNPSSLPQWRNAEDEIALKAWSDFCHEAGTEIWYWYYPGTYLANIAPCPNVLNVYYDMTFVINECNVDGFYHEGGGEIYSFAALKAHLATALLWDPDMTYEEFVEKCKEFLYIYYGEGYELIWEYILLHMECGNTDNCYLNGCDWPAKMYDLEYVAEHYEEMRKLITDAMEMTDDPYCDYNLELLLATCDFTGLSAVHDDWYVNGTREQKALYIERYMYHCSFAKANGIVYRSEMYAPEDPDPSVSLWEYAYFK
ncbi:MAG: DUF4838 domain-containing protein [Clostridia bacterium]|nr:DUF4838 domain-containing protein [Clostridia bacterium]